MKKRKRGRKDERKLIDLKKEKMVEKRGKGEKERKRKG